MVRFLTCTVLFVGTLALGGCQQPERDRCTVEGHASFDSQPLTSYHVVLFSEAVGGGSSEVTADGSFRFSGPIPEGEYVAYFAIPFDTKGEARKRAEAIPMPPKYRKAETSDYKVKISPGTNNLSIDLKP